MQNEIIFADRSCLARLVQEDRLCFTHEDDFWSEEMFAHQLPDARHIFLLERGEDGIRGYLCMTHILDEAEITRIGVFPHARRRGTAERLLRAGLELLGDLGVSELNLEVRQSNLPARRLYEKLGFVPVGRRKNYYPKENEDAILMKLIF